MGRRPLVTATVDDTCIRCYSRRVFPRRTEMKKVSDSKRVQRQRDRGVPLRSTDRANAPLFRGAQISGWRWLCARSEISQSGESPLEMAARVSTPVLTHSPPAGRWMSSFRHAEDTYSAKAATMGGDLNGSSIACILIQSRFIKLPTRRGFSRE